MQQTLLAICMILLTVITFLVMNRLYRRFSFSFFIPVLTSTVTIIIILGVFHIPYTSYMAGGHWISSLLEPAVVALAYPLYKQRHFLMTHWIPIVGGGLIGAVTGMVSVSILAKLFHMVNPVILSIIPKSLTTPVAIEVAKGMGGNVSMAVIGVMIAGIFGVIIAPTIFKLIRVHSPIGRGIALGSASHAIGTSKAAEYGELAFSMSSITMTLSAIIGSFLGPFVAWLFHI